MAKKTKNQARKIRHYRVRAKISGTASSPRINIFKSNTAFYAQVIDDEKGTTIISSSTQVLKIKKCNSETVKKVAKDLAKKAKEKNITNVVFDRGGYIYHGKIKSFADELKKEGLKF